MSDFRVPIAVALEAFGVPATVTRPAPNNDPIVTTGFWMSPLQELDPYGRDRKRRDPRRVFVLPRPTVPSLDRGAVIVAAEVAGDTELTWRVDGLEQTVDPDHWRAIVVQVAS